MHAGTAPAAARETRRGAKVITAFWRLARQVSRRLYFRVLLIACLALLSLLVAKLLGPVIPPGLSDAIGAKAVDPLLNTLAASMLSVTIFSLTIMTSTYRSAASQWSPRTHVILRDDTTTHSVLAIFVGAYLFALVAIVLRASHFFGEREIVVLFFFTIAVIAMILLSLMRWIAHLDKLGSFDETADQIQQRTERAVRAVARHPCYGARQLTDAKAEEIGSLTPVRAGTPGYVQQVFPERIQATAEAGDAQVYVIARIGTYVQAGDVLARVAAEKDLDDGQIDEIAAAILIDTTRSFVQDPGFGLSVLSEIGLRALSPGINDPETAIAMLHRLSSMMALLDTVAPDDETGTLDHVWMRKPELEQYFRGSFDRFAREAGTAIEVHLTIARELQKLAGRDRRVLAVASRASADRCAARARLALQDDPDLDRYLAATGRV